MPTAPGGTRRNARYTPLAVDGPLPAQMVRAVPAIRRDPLTWLEAAFARWGDLVALPMPRTPVLLVGSPTATRRVLQENHRAWGKATVQYTALSAVTGAGLLTADGELWRRRRRIAQPAFAHGALHGVADQAVAAADRVRSAWPGPGGTPVVTDVDDAVLHATLEVVGRTLFDTRLDPGAGERVVSAVAEGLEVVVRQARSPLPSWLPLPRRRRLARARAVLDEVCLGVVRQRRARVAAGGAWGDDLLGLLLASAEVEGGLAEREVRDELVTLVIAGHETVASSLAWTLRLLADHPVEQSRVADELTAVLGPPGASRAPGWHDLPLLRVTRAVVDEALRLYPPAWVVSRRALADDVLDGVAVPAGSVVVLSPWVLGRRSASWGDPLAFRPGRFLDASGRPRADYVPFGAGPRLCIGRDFALVESVLVLAGLLRDHALEPVGPPPAVDALVTLRPRGGMPLRVRRRDAVPQ